MTIKVNKCVACLQLHQLFKGPKFNKMKVHERWNLVKSKSLCENCLRSNHVVQNCRTSIKCKVCGLSHHSSLHVKAQNSANQINANISESVSNSSQYIKGEENYNILLLTAISNVKSPNEQVMRSKALIDSACQNSLISNKCRYL